MAIDQKMVNAIGSNTDYNYNILVSELIFKCFTRNVSHSFVSSFSTLPDSVTPSADMTVHATKETHRPTLQKHISTLQTNNILILAVHIC